MNRQLLPRRPSTRTAPAPVTAPVPAPSVETPRATSVTPAPVRVLRRPVVLALLAAAAVVLAGLGWTLLSSRAEPTDPAPATPRSRTAGAVPTSPAGRTKPGGTAGRNPFANTPAPAVAAPTTPPHVVPSPAAPSPAGGATTSPAPAGTGQPTASAAPTVTVTVTNPSAPTYVGLYAWNGSRASFRVNARTYSVHVGTRFGPGLTFTAVVPGDPPCARVTHAKGSFTLCPGQVTTLP